MKNLLIVSLFLFLTLPTFASEAGHFGLGINYGLVNNLKIWDSQSSEAGSMLRVDYTYDFNDFYTAAVEIGFFADENVFKSTSVSTHVQTITCLAIDHTPAPNRQPNLFLGPVVLTRISLFILL